MNIPLTFELRITSLKFNMDTEHDVLARTFLSITTICGVHVRLWGVQVYISNCPFSIAVSVYRKVTKNSAVIRHPLPSSTITAIRWAFISRCWHTRTVGVLFESRGTNLQTFYYLQSLFWVLDQHWESNETPVYIVYSKCMSFHIDSQTADPRYCWWFRNPKQPAGRYCIPYK